MNDRENNQMLPNDIRNKNDESSNTKESNNENNVYFDENTTSVEYNNKENQWASPTEPSQPSRDHHSHDHYQDIKDNIYKIGSTDMWGCKRCNSRGDKWFMQKHPCKGLVKKRNQLLQETKRFS